MKRRDFVLSLFTSIQTGLLVPSLAQATAAGPSIYSPPTTLTRQAVIGLGGWGTRAVEDFKHFLGHNAPTERLFAAVSECGSHDNRVIGRYGEIPRSILRPIDQVTWMKDDLRDVNAVIFVAHLIDPSTVEHLPRHVAEAGRLGLQIGRAHV